MAQRVILSRFTFPDADQEFDFRLWKVKRTCYDTVYPFHVLSGKGILSLDFEPVTILYGGNGSGKTTAINVIAETLGLKRDSLYNRSNFFEDYTAMCRYELRGELSGDRLHAFLGDLFAPYACANVEAVVLGCTHYVFLKNAIQAHFPGVPLVDGNEGTVRQLRRRLDEMGLLAPETSKGAVELLSSGGKDAVRQMEILLRL